MPEQISTLKPVENAMLEEIDIPEGTVAHRGCILEEGKSVRRRMSREKALCTNCNPLPP